MSRKHHLIGLFLTCFMLILVYALSIFFANMSNHLFFISNPIYYEKIKYINSLPKILLFLYIIYIHLLSIIIYYLYPSKKIKGWLCLNIVVSILWTTCLGLEVLLSNDIFKPLFPNMIYFSISLVSLNILYLLFCFYDLKQKNKFKESV